MIIFTYTVREAETRISDVLDTIHKLPSKGRKVYYIGIIKKGEDKGLGDVKFLGCSEYVTKRIEEAEAEADESDSTFGIDMLSKEP